VSKQTISLFAGAVLALAQTHHLLEAATGFLPHQGRAMFSNQMSPPHFSIFAFSLG
jgi:hypothetical protein